MVPIKWLAIESLTNRIFNSSTDVWSFGVFMWELFTLMEVPYAELTDDNLLGRLKSGYRLPRPRYANRALYDIIVRCWIKDPRQRPRFDELAQQLRALLPAQMAQKFVDMNTRFIQANIEDGRDSGDYLDGLLSATNALSAEALPMLPLRNDATNNSHEYSPLPTLDGYTKMYPVLHNNEF